ncbi:translation initiation factor IF-2 [Parabacteroides hominis]|jgi:translation initiation factor IF-2|uniref:Translation initiation factor IF-2 n=1 Tax=Parabacteroides hominis TaxID=2763057 RepID=A0ABR7DPB0_9BACT|nr:translation initiation factor IF-2 [Parabacteroides hominis]MBC5633269.1 translation initiation factor IF-2 [Parabacteroides hominis]
MPIKLIQVQRKLNVGINTVVEFLRKKGFEVEDNNPNTRIGDEQYALLVKEFGKDLPNGGRERERVVPERPHREASSVKEERNSEIKTVIPEEFKPKIVTKGRIDLDRPHKKAQEVQHQPVSAPVEKKVEKPVEAVSATKTAEAPVQEVKAPEAKVPEVKAPEVKAPEAKMPEAKVTEVKQQPEEIKEEKVIVVEKEPAEVIKPEPVQEPKAANVESTTAKSEEPAASAGNGSDEELFRLNTPKFESKIKVTGKIDLNALNQSTRPKKKTKEERKKEREDKREKFAGNKPGQQSGNGPFNKGPKDATARPGAPVKPGEGGADAKKKRNRIKKDRVDVNNTPGTNARPSRPNDDRKPRLRKPVKAEISEEDVQKQVKETLARLTNKGNKNNKGAKYRRDKRDAFQKREHELMEQEEMESKVLKLTEFVTANDLANMMDVPVTKVIGTCMSIGIMVSINQRLDAETINIVAEEFGFKTEYVSAEVVEAIKADEEEDNEEDWVARPPIVTVMGHVDHGKTSLLDNIRNANVIAGEAGGITQHIGAYNVKLQSGRRITFLDTPGHEAFTAMRARGAKVTDIAIIIVAADDNVMPQTVEAINHASAAGVPIVFAINKIDKPHANPDKIKEELANMNYLVEDWGGKYQSQEISAKKGMGVEELLEKVLLEADLLDLKANPKRRAVGSIIESSLDKGRGYVSTVLVENGTLKVGDIVLAGTHFGRVKAMFNERNQRIEQAGPSEPALILGLNGAPQAGDTFNVLETDQEAREIANRREQLQRELGLRTQKMLTLDDIGRRIAVGNFQELNVIVKGDVDGSVEALSDSLIRLSTDEIQVNVIHKAVGQISESDVVLAAASSAIIIGFQVRPALPARRLAEKEGVEIRLYSIIYDAIEEVKSAMEGMLSPEIKEEITANVEVQQVFKITKVGTIAGCMVREGKIKRSNKVRVIRDGIVVHSGELESLKRFKDDVKEVVAGLDCGLNIVNYNDIQVGDIIEAYEETEIKKTL